MRSTFRPTPSSCGRVLALHAVLSLAVVAAPPVRGADAGDQSTGSAPTPYDRQVADRVAKLTSFWPAVRAGAAEGLGFLRAYAAADELIEALGDSTDTVRREAAMSLAWCGGRPAVEPLLAALDDEDWVTAQAAHVALENLTGMALPFDALAEPARRKARTQAWRDWWGGVPADRPPARVLALARNEGDDEARLRAVRALGALGGEGATQAVLHTLLPFRDRAYDRLNPLEKHLVQSCLRSLGRLRDPDALPALLDFFDSADWARYAADALGDFGDPKVVGPLIAAFPKYSKPPLQPQRRPDAGPRDDRFSGDNTQDRMHETPYEIAVALARLPLDNAEHRAALRDIVPFLLSNMPCDWDSGLLYEPEAFELVTAYLLDQAGMRRAVCEAAYSAVAEWEKWQQPRRRNANRRGERRAERKLSTEELLPRQARLMIGDVPYVAAWLPAFCRDEEDVPRLIGLLEHANGWIRINATKALMFIGDPRAVEPIARILEASKPEALYGYSGALEHAEYNSPTPRWREALVRALGRLGAERHTGLLVSILGDKRNVVDIQHAAARALDELGTPQAMDALAEAEVDHPLHSVRMVAREALWRGGLLRRDRGPDAHPAGAPRAAPDAHAATERVPEAVVFIKGNNKMRSDFNGQAGVDPWRQTYTITNSGPTMRVGRNLYVLRPVTPDGTVTPLTHFEDGFVADCEVSYDGKRILFARRLNGEERNYREAPFRKAALRKPGEPLEGGPDDPWWHIWEINVDGTGLRRITSGPYHHVQPTYLPDGRIVFSSSRLGLRDEYHGFPALGLTVMNADGSDIHTIGFNLGGDREPAVLDDGRIVFSRVDNFYSRLKSELMLHTVFPDGTQNTGFYGPERRGFWMAMHRKYAAWTRRGAYGGSTDNRNRVLRLSQPQPFGDGRVVCATSGGLALVGPGRQQETLIPHDRKMAVTSPFPWDDRHLLCAATIKRFEVDGRIVTCGTEAFERLAKGPRLFRSAIDIDLGLYLVDVETGEMELLYNDPETADFEARPIRPRRRPVVLTESPQARSRGFTARLFCKSARISQEKRVRNRGKLVRVIEGQPFVSRHETQQSTEEVYRNHRWKNHGGTHARVLGTAPLAADGSFFVEIPADRLVHLQILDSDRRVVGNQLFWMYARPGETRSCVGCHENRDQTQSPDHTAFTRTANMAPIEMLPRGDEFSYRAKAWLKGTLPDETEERSRTVRAVNLIARY